MIGAGFVLLTALLGAAVGAEPTVGAEPRAPFTVGPVVVRPGEMASGLVPVPGGSDAATFVPVTVAHGARPGPVLALIAGNHGYEYAPIVALKRLRTRLDPASLAGTVILVHVANVPSFLGRTVYYGPVDGKNLNRMYPGKADGSVSERIARTITVEVIERAGFVLDLHCGDGNESLRPYTYWDAAPPTPRWSKRRDSSRSRSGSITSSSIASVRPTRRRRSTARRPPRRAASRRSRPSRAGSG